MKKTWVSVGVIGVIFLTITCDIYQPEISIVSPKEGQVYTGFYEVRVPIEIEVSDNEAVGTLTLILDEDTLLNGVTPPVKDTFIVDGDSSSHRITIVAYDKAGNWIKDSVSFITAPYYPKLITTLELPDYLSDMELVGDTLWVAMGSELWGQSKVRVACINLKSLPKPPTVNTFDNLQGKSAWGMDIEGGYLYMVTSGVRTGDTLHGLTIYRIGSGLELTLVGNCNPSSRIERDVAINGGTAFLTGGVANKIYVVNISNKAIPLIVDSFNLEHEALRLALSENRLAVVSYYDVSVYDISNLQNITKLASFDVVGGDFDWRAEPTWFEGDLYMGGYDGIYRVTGISNNYPALDEIGDVSGVGSVIRKDSLVFFEYFRDLACYFLSDGSISGPFKLWDSRTSGGIGEIILYGKYVLYGLANKLVIFQFEE